MVLNGKVGGGGGTDSVYDKRLGGYGDKEECSMGLINEVAIFWWLGKCAVAKRDSLQTTLRQLLPEGAWTMEVSSHPQGDVLEIQSHGMRVHAYVDAMGLPRNMTMRRESGKLWYRDKRFTIWHRLSTELYEKTPSIARTEKDLPQCPAKYAGHRCTLAIDHTGPHEVECVPGDADTQVAWIEEGTPTPITVTYD